MEKLNQRDTMVLIIASMGFGALASYQDIVRVAGQTWLLVIIIGFIVAAFCAFVCGFLAYRFPNQTVFEYSQTLLGKPISWVITLVYFGYFLISAAFLLSRFAHAVGTVLLPQTPIEITLASLLAVTIFLSSRGISIIAKTSKTLIIIAIIAMIVMLIPTLGKFNSEEIYGMWRFQADDIKFVILSGASVFFGFEFLLIAGGFSRPTKKAMISAPAAVLITGLIVFATQFVMFGVFGMAGITHLSFPTIELAKTIAFQTSLSRRFDVIYMVGWIVSIFLSISITQYGAAFSLAFLTKMKDYTPYCLMMAPLLMFCAMLPVQDDRIRAAYGIYGMITAFGIPVLLAATALIRRRKG